MNTNQLLIILAALILFSKIAYSEESIKITQTISAQKVAIKNQFDIKVALMWKDSQGKIDFKPIDPPKSDHIKLLSSKEKNITRIIDDDLYTVKEVTYTYEASRAGSAELSPAKVRYRTKKKWQLLESDGMAIAIITQGEMLREKITTLSIGLLGVAILLTAIILIIRSRSKEESALDSNKAEVPESQLLTVLEDIKKESIALSADKKIDKLTTSFTQYIKEKYHIEISSPNAPILSEAKVSDDIKSLFHTMSDLSEKVRFGGYMPTKEEEDRLWRAVEKIAKNNLPKKNPLQGIKFRKK